MVSPEIKECLSKNSSGVSLNTILKEASPESKCPICLDHFKNISYLDVCLHKFCFSCIHEWSKNKAECPLCKQPFNSIYHTIKAENDYKRFDLRPTENGSFGNMAGQRFRYRTTLTGDRRPAPRRTSPPPDHGILFEGLSGSLPQQHNRDLHRMMRRLAARQRAESEGRSTQSPQEQEVIKFRRALYRRGVRVQRVQDGGRTRETSAEFFKRNPACLHRLVPWLRRELTVLYGSHGSLVNIVQHIIMTLITRHNVDDQVVVHELRPYLLSRTEHFLHEFLSFAQSPFNMGAYDQHAVYDLPGPSAESSSSDTSVIAISEDEGDPLMEGAQDYATPRVTLSQAAWDDETPGPSYSSEPSQVLPFLVGDSEAVVSVEPHQDHQVNADSTALVREHSSDGDEDCVIIGYVKPVTERTPELVQLSSDSEQSEQNGGPPSPRSPQHIRFTSEPDSPPSVTQSLSRRSKRGSQSPDDTTQMSSNQHGQEYDKSHLKTKLTGSRERSSHNNRTHSCSHSRKHPFSKEGKDKWRQEEENSHRTSSFWHSYSHYSKRDSGRRYYSETCSSYSSYYRNVYNRSRSPSHSRRRSRERRDRSRSWSNSRISSNSSNRHDRSGSRSNSKMNSNSSSRQGRSHSKSNSRVRSSHQTSRHDESGKKRKYKTKHLEEPSGESSRKSYAESADDCAKKKNKKHHKKSKRKSRSPSTDIVYDDKSERHNRKHHKKKKHKRKSKRRKSKERTDKPSPVLITITSDSDSTDPTLPSSSNICASTSTIVDSATESKLLESSFLDMGQQGTAGVENSAIGDDSTPK
ncbi:topoisomerase I binding, arginine/serine-rich a [Xyrauchen texanus]|uniref:topoisomerase I binding, arginine/serine-rich a n=1 Tax=Xyrauchen texanus TaxID=154827 RepID=UPI002241B98F|nr:topoisomerase I binding, arginine/serine-rich a [Xyrauchen texanus]